VVAPGTLHADLLTGRTWLGSDRVARD